MSATPTEIGPFLDPAFSMLSTKEPRGLARKSVQAVRPAPPSATDAGLLHGQITAMMFAANSQRVAERQLEPSQPLGGKFEALASLVCGVLSVLVGAAVTALTWTGLQGRAIRPFHQPRPKMAWSTIRELDVFQMSVLDKNVYGLYGTYFAPSSLLVLIALFSVGLALLGLVFKARLGKVSLLSLLGLGLFVATMGLGMVYEYQATHS